MALPQQSQLLVSEHLLTLRVFGMFHDVVFDSGSDADRKGRRKLAAITDIAAIAIRYVPGDPDSHYVELVLASDKPNVLLFDGDGPKDATANKLASALNVPITLVGYVELKPLSDEEAKHLLSQTLNIIDAGEEVRITPTVCERRRRAVVRFQRDIGCSGILLIFAGFIAGGMYNMTPAGYAWWIVVFAVGSIAAALWEIALIARYGSEEWIISHNCFVIRKSIFGMTWRRAFKSERIRLWMHKGYDRVRAMVLIEHHTYGAITLYESATFEDCRLLAEQICALTGWDLWRNEYNAF